MSSGFSFLCEKAIKKGIINLHSCPKAKLSANHKSLHLGLNPPSIVSVKTQKPKKKSIVIYVVPTEKNSSSDDEKSLSDLSETDVENDNDEPPPTVKINIVLDDANVTVNVALEHERQVDFIDDQPNYNRGELHCHEEEEEEEK